MVGTTDEAGAGPEAFIYKTAPLLVLQKELSLEGVVVPLDADLEAIPGLVTSLVTGAAIPGLSLFLNVVQNTAVAPREFGTCSRESEEVG